MHGRFISIPRSMASKAVLAGLLLGLPAVTAGCGGGSSEDHIDAPLVRQFSPTLSPIDFNNLQQNPTYTDDRLTVSTSPQYPNEIVIIFQSGTQLDPASVFLGGDSSLGLDPSAVSITQYIPGSGNVLVPMAKVIVEADRIRCLPDALWNLDGGGNPVLDPGGAMPNAQYSVGVFQNVRNIRSKPLQEGPVFHAFVVGALDTTAPSVVTTVPVDGEENVGAGAPPPDAAKGTTAQGVADVRTNIFGPTSPDILVRFNEAIANASVTTNNFRVEDAGAFIPGGGAPPQIAPAPGFPKLKSVSDATTLPSNGHEILWRPDLTLGGFPFGTTVQVTVVGLYNTQASFLAGGPPENAAPIRDLSGNGMEVSKVFTFRTLRLPDLPDNPFPEYATWWSAPDRVGVIDQINQQARADQFNGTPFPNGIPANVMPAFADTVATSTNIPGFDPTEINLDGRTHPTTCHSYVYVISPSSGQIVILNTRNGLPVAIINTSTPGGISNCTGPADTGGSTQAPNVLAVTNSSANTYTVFDISKIAPGTTFLSGPIYVQKVVTTGNTPRAIAMSVPSDTNFHRDNGAGGPKPELIMWADFTDGVVNVTTLAKTTAVRRFNLGPTSAPNDIAMSPCIGGSILFGAISQGGSAPLQGKVAYYIAGPGCTTGTTTPGRPDSIVGDKSGLDAPAGLDDAYLPPNDPTFFLVTESGSQRNAVTMLGFETGANNFPTVIQTVRNVGQNPVAVCHADSYVTPCITFINDPFNCNPTHPFCWYNNTKQKVYQVSVQFGGHQNDATFAESLQIYVCARGSGRIVALDVVTGINKFYQPPAIPGVRFVATHATQ